MPLKIVHNSFLLGRCEGLTYSHVYMLLFSQGQLYSLTHLCRKRIMLLI